MPMARVGSINLHYETYGSGEPLLLIMGLAMPGAAWTPALPFLSGFKTILFDNRGTGMSDRPPDTYSVPVMAGDAVGLLDALEIRSAKVYGISMGGMIAQQMAVSYPERVSKLVLGCTSAGGITAIRPRAEVLMNFIDALRQLGSDPEHALDGLLPLLYPKEFLTHHPEVKALMMLAFAGMPPLFSQSVERLLMGIGEFDVYEQLPQIKCPTLVIHGDQDVVIPVGNAEILRQRIPGAQLWTIPGAGHNFMGMDIAGITHRISQWLRS